MQNIPIAQLPFISLTLRMMCTIYMYTECIILVYRRLHVLGGYRWWCISPL